MSGRRFHRRRLLGALAAVTLAVSGCGGDEDSGPKPPEGVSRSDFERQLRDAEQVSAADFPATRGRSLEEVAGGATAGAQVGLATSVLEPGENRLAFGVIGPDRQFLYGKSAVYVARTPKSRAQGPFPAPADSLVTKPEFRSRQAASEEDEIAAVYATQVRFKGLREPLREFNLQTEPWLFTVDRDGRVAARLEGSFGRRAFEDAIKAALG